jgi:hypothetical protein
MKSYSAVCGLEGEGQYPPFDSWRCQQERGRTTRPTMRRVLHENPYNSVYGSKDSKCHTKRQIFFFIADYGHPQKEKKDHKNAGGITNVWLHQIPFLNQPNQKSKP